MHKQGKVIFRNRTARDIIFYGGEKKDIGAYLGMQFAYILCHFISIAAFVCVVAKFGENGHKRERYGHMVTIVRILLL